MSLSDELFNLDFIAIAIGFRVAKRRGIGHAGTLLMTIATLRV